jgi:hypothetical protein
VFPAVGAAGRDSGSVEVVLVEGLPGLWRGRSFAAKNAAQDDNTVLSKV